MQLHLPKLNTKLRNDRILTKSFIKMNWLKKIFDSSPPKPETPSQEPSFNLDDSIDMEFINCIYFKDDQSKADYINAVKIILKATVANDKIESGYYGPNLTTYFRAKITSVSVQSLPLVKVVQ